MKCKKPFRKGLIEAGCRRCLPCWINEQRLWTIRGVLEAGQHLHSSFVTLTKDDEHLGDGSVSVREAQLFLKNLRYARGPFRYLLCGEYGEHTWRPHYHAILFGVRDGLGVADAWQKGHIHISGVGPESIAYVAGYCLKGAHTTRGMRCLGKSLNPEFRLMSRRPGLGAVAADRIAGFYTSRVGSKSLVKAGAVSPVVRFTKGMWPLGRYLVERIRVGSGLDEECRMALSQMSRAAQLQSYDQPSLNAYIKLITGQSEQSGFRAEEKYKRIALEKKL